MLLVIIPSHAVSRQEFCCFVRKERALLLKMT